MIPPHAAPGGWEEPHAMQEFLHAPPSHATRAVLYLLALLFFCALLWAALGKLDIIASAEGRLVPASLVKIVQPSDAGMVRQILVREGDTVGAGQVLMRMDGSLLQADLASVGGELDSKRWQLRRIDAELAGTALLARPEDMHDPLFIQARAQLAARRQSQQDSLEQEQQALSRALHELAAAIATHDKFRQSATMLREQAESYARLGREGFFPALQVQEKTREAIERERELQAQAEVVQSLRAAEALSRKRLAQIASSYESALRNERVETASQSHRLEQELNKLRQRQALLELKSPQDGVVKEVFVHTPGSVVTPGAILLTLVPGHEALLAEVQIRNDDVGFVQVGRKAKVKLTAYPFQKYGMLEGAVIHLGADAQDAANTPTMPASAERSRNPSWQGYKALVALDAQYLASDKEKLALVPGMQVIAEIRLGQRTVLEYLLSPLRRAMHDSARER
ncbi:HlyD family type I secretion periplasmic adaptor subunit [Noviherbaspirillum soli]|uniref:HlyD family type I secretion periplasmic adaptor subunit n=1 Tax=Noviherbaspirillum soli TaxID=1064518 RepID=UPI00188ABE83|nr:HlyD family type I secretion periplasmic adaptor subunit [Noviherbaspirillum soli]